MMAPAGIKIGVIEPCHEIHSKLFTQTFVHECQLELPWIPMFNPKTPHMVTSPIFKFGMPGCFQSSWRIQASPDCFQANRRIRTIGLYLWRMHPEELKAQKEIIQYNQEKMYPLGNDVKIKYKFEILDADGNAQFTRESELKVIPKGAAIGGRNFASYEEAIRRKCIDSERRMTVRTSITMYQIMDSGNDHAGYQKITIKFGGEVIGLYDPFRLARGSSLDKWIKDSIGNFLSAVDLESAIHTNLSPERPKSEINQKALSKGVQEMCTFLETGKCESLTKTGVLRIKIKLYQLGQMFEIPELKKQCIASIINHNLSIPECLKVVRFFEKVKILQCPEYTQQINALKDFVRRNIKDLQATDDFVKSCEEYDKLYAQICLEPGLSNESSEDGKEAA